MTAGISVGERENYGSAPATLAQAATPEEAASALDRRRPDSRPTGQRMRDDCMALFSEVASAGNSEPLPPFSPSDWKNCYEIFQPPQPASYIPVVDR